MAKWTPPTNEELCYTAAAARALGLERSQLADFVARYGVEPAGVRDLGAGTYRVWRVVDIAKLLLRFGQQQPGPLEADQLERIKLVAKELRSDRRRKATIIPQAGQPAGANE